jgi:hypothetical protein
MVKEEFVKTKLILRFDSWGFKKIEDNEKERVKEVAMKQLGKVKKMFLIKQNHLRKS